MSEALAMRTAQPERMLRFDVTTTDALGERATQRMDATSRSLLRRRLSAEGHVVLGIREVRPWWRPEPRTVVPRRVLLDTTRQLAAFAGAGISVLDALAMIADSTGSKRMRAVLSAMLDDVRDGDTLPMAARAHPGVFPDHYIAMLEAAERTGNLAATFDALAQYMERDNAARRAVKAALAYPTVLVILGGVAVTVLTVAVLPKFATFFRDLNVPLPTATRVLLATAGTIGTSGPLLVVGFGTAFLAFGASLRTTRGRYAFDAAKLRVPVVGPLVRDISMERFCRVLGNLAAAGVPLVEAMRLTGASVGNARYAKAVQATRDGLMRGEGLAEPMARTGHFPDAVVQVLRVGEQTGRLTEQLDHATRFYAREVDYRLKALTAFLEPAALLLVGGAVGFVAVALVSAMYGIYSTSAVTG